jgi:two-component system alkaline phosphatase synthesis response regulator PhoP
MVQAQILIVEDEKNVRLVLEHSLRRCEYMIETAVNGQDALQKISRNHFDLLLLDLHIGQDVNGLQVMEAARQQDSDVSVIILTGQASLETAVEALRLGAFDYLFKPADPATICERVQDALAQKQRAKQKQQILSQINDLRAALNQLDDEMPVAKYGNGNGRFLHSNPLVIDKQHRVVTIADELLELTTTEFDLLTCLVEDSPLPVAPVDLVRRALGYQVDNMEARDTVRWHIYQLRRKIEPDPKHPIYIKTVRYKGYMWAKRQ